MVALCLADNKTNDDGDGKENGENNMFILTNNNFARASRHFEHFFAVVAPCDMKLPNFKSLLFFFLNLDNNDKVPKKISPRLAKLNETG